MATKVIERNISETPDRWSIIEIENGGVKVFKVFGTWAGGYLGSDRWKMNSGIVKVEEDEDNYYFYGYSGSCYQCHKKGYGVMTSYGQSILNDLVENAYKANAVVTVMDDNNKWGELIKEDE